MTLNGEWQFEIDKAADGESRGLTHGKDLNSKIIVPFCPESKLSGLGLGNTQKLKDVWQRQHNQAYPMKQQKRKSNETFKHRDDRGCNLVGGGGGLGADTAGAGFEKACRYE